MAHGAGGKATRTPGRGAAAPAFGIEALDDAAAGRRRSRSPPTRSWSSRCASRAGRSASWRSTARSTTSRWAGAKPLALTRQPDPRGGPRRADVLRAEVDAIARAARRPACAIVGGDTKVVERGHADGMYITTTGIGRRDPRAAFEPRAPGRPDPALRPDRPRTARRSCSPAASSSSTPTSSPTRARCGPRSTRCSGRASACMRDATRGGVASVLNELARAAGVAMLVREAAVPVAPAVAGACELLGIDPMYVANEGVFVAIVAPERARLAGLRRHRRGQDRAARHGAGARRASAASG